MEVEIKTETDHTVQVTKDVSMRVTAEMGGDFLIAREEVGLNSDLIVNISRAELEALAACIASALGKVG